MPPSTVYSVRLHQDDAERFTAFAAVLGFTPGELLKRLALEKSRLVANEAEIRRNGERNTLKASESA